MRTDDDADRICNETVHFNELRSMLELAAKASITLMRAVWFIVGIAVMSTLGYASLLNRVGNLESNGSSGLSTRVKDLEDNGSRGLKTFVAEERSSREQLTKTLSELDKTLRLLQQDQKYQDIRIDKIEKKLP